MGLNLHGVVRGIIQAAVPDQPVVISESTGYTIADDGTQIPAYNSFPVMGQIQAASSKDLRLLDGINLNGTYRSIYFYGDVEDIIRSLKKGGDIITFADASEWLVVMVPETWNVNWCHVLVCLQSP